MNVHRRDRMEAENAALIEMLGSLNDPVARELAGRMRRCRVDRIRRREGAFTTLVEVMRARQYKCKTVACWACRSAHVRRKKEEAKQVFLGAANEDCSFVTINAAAPALDLDEVAAQHTKFSADLNNLRDALARRDRRFNRIAVFVVLEVQYDVASSSWEPHWHLALWHERIDRQAVALALKTRWQGYRRIHIKPFDVAKDAVGNAKDVTGYALKFHHWDWPLHAAASWWLWLRKRAALRSICVKIGRRTQARPFADIEEPSVVEPMPILV
jgi:hypothetical protein